MSMKKDSAAQRHVVCMLLEIPAEIHANLKVAAKLDNRSMRMFVLEAIKERSAKFMVENIDSETFVPMGLRK